MRRKSERTATKKTKASPEKKEKPEKGKRPKTRRRKQSTSSDHESADETKPEPPPAQESVAETNPPQTSAKEASPEETNEQVWQVKAAEGDTGEIQKLKICLTRPPSTPERVDRSPRSKRKHSRSASGEPTEDRKKSKHRSKRSSAEMKEGSDKNRDSQGDEPEENEQEEKVTDEGESSQKQEVTSNETPISTTTEESKPSEDTKSSEGTDTVNAESNSKETQNTETKSESEDKQPSDADTTVVSPKSETEDSQNSLTGKEESSRQRSISGDKSEILEIHADESRLESSDITMNESQHEKNTIEVPGSESPRPESPKPGSTESESLKTESSIPALQRPSKEDNVKGDDDLSKVSITGDKTESINSENTNSTGGIQVATNKPNVVETSMSPEKEKISLIAKDTEKQPEDSKESKVRQSTPEAEPSPVIQEGTVHNGQATTHSSRKRRWGSRSSKLTTQKSITISTDVLKDIIPDVKPAEFDEVIEEKKHHRRVEVTEKLERPVLPKIVIDNTESVELNKKESDDRDKENIKIRESNLSSNRKISIVKDNDSIITRPPSPPRHKQSNILFITNLVRPFTLPQLKNLLQRTGRIVDNGFWIDRIKSKCYVQYETEDQAVETRHALHGVTWPVSNPKTLHVDFSTKDDFDKAKANEDTDNAQVSTIPGTVEDWLREQDLKRERGELEKPWERKTAMREWDVGKNEKGKEKDKVIRDERLPDKRRHRTPERSPEPARKFKKKEEEPPAKLLDDLFRKTKATPCIYWLPLSAETIAIKEEQRRQHMAEHERRLQELRRTHRRH